MSSADLAASDEALKPLLHMIKDCDASNISTIRTLILKAFTDPEIFAGFDEIKLLVKDALASAPGGEALLRSLDLFSYGVYRDYMSDTSQYVALTDSQVNKLKLLTVVSLVQQSCGSTSLGTIPYATVAQELGITADDLETLRQVEEVIIACIYAGIVNGKLCQKTKILTVSSVDGPPCHARDVPPSQVSVMLETLRGLQQNLDAAVSAMEVEKTDIQGRRDAALQAWKDIKNPDSKKSADKPSSGGWPTNSNSVRMPETNRSTSASSSSTARRQTKRSRGGFGGSIEPFGRF